MVLYKQKIEFWRILRLLFYLASYCNTSTDPWKVLKIQSWSFSLSGDFLLLKLPLDTLSLQLATQMEIKQHHIQLFHLTQLQKCTKNAIKNIIKITRIIFLLTLSYLSFIQKPKIQYRIIKYLPSQDSLSKKFPVWEGTKCGIAASVSRLLYTLERRASKDEAIRS